MALSYNPQYLSTQYLGPLVPIEDRSDRKKELFSSNLAPSYVPAILLDQSPKRINWNGQEYWVPYTWVPTDNLMLRPMVTLDLVYALADDIMNQFESRVISFWRQLLLVHRTGIQFLFCDRADLQVGIPGGSMMPDSAKNAFECAHTATLPALRAQSTLPGFVIAFGQFSTFHYLDNATTWLPSEVNQVDSALDRYARCEYIPLRQAATQILNWVSNGCMTPKLGLIWFISYARVHLLAMLGEERDAKKNYIINYYGLVVDKFQAFLNEEGFIQKFSSCALPDDDLYAVIQKGMHDLFISEMAPKRPCIDPGLLNELKNANYYEIHMRLQAYTGWENTPAIHKHVNQACLNIFVNVCALNYAKCTSIAELDLDLFYLKEKRMTARLSQVHSYVMASLSKQKPHHIHSILFYVLVNLPRHFQNLKDQGLIT